jgi:hypothetical protein
MVPALVGLDEHDLQGLIVAAALRSMPENECPTSRVVLPVLT